MKIITTILFALFLASNAFADKMPELKIAIYDNNKLQKQIGYQGLRELEYGPKYRKSIIDMKRKLSELEDRLITAKNDQELKRVNLELSFVKNKMSSIKSLAQSRANRGNDSIELTALIKRVFSGKYAVILQKGSSSNAFHNAIHANVKYVDITEEVSSLITKELSGDNTKQ